MDDYSISSLNESKNEWCARLLNLLTPHFLSGINSVYNESVSICETNKERNKYLMTFQNFLSRIPHWNSHIIENERERIIEASECHYLEDLITCIYIIQLKMLSCMRVSHENKKIDLNIPSLDTFIHTVYINIAKKVYTNVYLFEENVEAMTKQRNNREVEFIVRECIINTVRDSIPVAELLRIFMDESEEHDVVTETREVLGGDGDGDTGGGGGGGGDSDVGGDGGGLSNETDESAITVKKADDDKGGDGGDTFEPFNLTSNGDKDGGDNGSGGSGSGGSVVLGSELDDIAFPDRDGGEGEGGGGAFPLSLSPRSTSIKFSDEVKSISTDGNIEVSHGLSPADGYSSDHEGGDGGGGGGGGIKLKIGPVDGASGGGGGAGGGGDLGVETLDDDALGIIEL